MKTNKEKKNVSKVAEAKTPAAKSAAKKTTVSSAAKKPSNSSSKTAVKSSTANKTVSAKAATAPKKTARKSKVVTIENLCSLIEKRIDKTKAAAIKDLIAVDIEVWGFEDGSNRKMYIEIMNGNVSVMPHSYEAKTFRVSLSFKNAFDFANGKITLAKLIESKDFYAEGVIVPAVKLAAVF